VVPQLQQPLAGAQANAGISQLQQPTTIQPSASPAGVIASSSVAFRPAPFSPRQPVMSAIQQPVSGGHPVAIGNVRQMGVMGPGGVPGLVGGARKGSTPGRVPLATLGLARPTSQGDSSRLAQALASVKGAGGANTTANNGSSSARGYPSPSTGSQLPAGNKLGTSTGKTGSGVSSVPLPASVVSHAPREPSIKEDGEDEHSSESTTTSTTLPIIGGHPTQQPQKQPSDSILNGSTAMPSTVVVPPVLSHLSVEATEQQLQQILTFDQGRRNK